MTTLEGMLARQEQPSERYPLETHRSGGSSLSTVPQFKEAPSL